MARNNRLRTHIRLTYIVPFLIALFLVFAAVFFYLGKPLPEGRQTVVILGDPVEVASYDPITHDWAVVQLSKDAHVSGVFGLGEYSLESLWKLGQSEASPSMFLRESLAEELGIPIPNVIGYKTDTFRAWEGTTHIQSFLSWQKLFSYLKGDFVTNMDIHQILVFIRIASSLNPASTQRYILRENTGLVQKIANDGTAYLRYDRAAFDTRTGDVLEEAAVREEAVRVVVYNTTDRPAVGSRVGRMIDKLGAFVVSVANDTNSLVQSCEISGTKEKLQTKTSKRIQSLFGCTAKEDDTTGQGDLYVRVGNDFAKRYIFDAK